jgi:hypothetical protein
MVTSVTGMHQLDWSLDARATFVSNFNACSEQVLTALSQLESQVDAGKVSKDKTRPLQFLPTAELLEASIEYLVKPMTYADAQKLSPEELIQKLASVKIDEVLDRFPGAPLDESSS